MTQDGIGSTHLIEFLAWVEVNKKRLLVGAGVLLAVAAVAYVYRWYRVEAERAASDAVLKVQIAARPGGDTRGPSAGDFLKVAADHAGTSAAGRAVLLAAEALYRDARYEEARKEFERAAGLLTDDSLRGVAAFGVAACLDAQGKTNEALTAYQDVTVRHGTTGVAGQARLALAGLQEARGDAAQALKLYSELTNATGSPWRTEALVRREALLSRHPELAPTNAPPAGAPAGAPGAPLSLPTPVPTAPPKS